MRFEPQGLWLTMISSGWRSRPDDIQGHAKVAREGGIPMINVDNRIMYRVGAVAREMKIIDWDFVMGIPLSVTGKSIYFDR